MYSWDVLHAGIDEERPFVGELWHTHMLVDAGATLWELDVQAQAFGATNQDLAAALKLRSR